MGQEPSKPADALDPGPLSDDELASVVAVYRARAGAGDTLSAEALDEWLGLPTSFYGVARGGAAALTLPAFVAFCGAALRGAASARAGHVVRAGLGVDELVDKATGDSRTAPRGAVAAFLGCCAALYGVPTSDVAPLAASLARAADADVAEGVETGGPERVAAGAAARWADRHAPTLADAWAAHVRGRLAGVSPPRAAPALAGASDALDGASLLALGMASPRCAGATLRRLYASGTDGLSFFRLCDLILGWAGPSLLVVRATGGQIFGALLDEPWRDAFDFYGGSGCLVLGLAPVYVCCRPRLGSNRQFQYLNTKGSAAKVKGLCVGSGGSPASARLLVPDALADAAVYVRETCLAFEAGDVAGGAAAADGGAVDVAALEVWGVGDADALAAADAGRAANREDRAAFVQRTRQVDKAKFLDSAFDREHLLGKTFAGGSAGANR